MNEIIQKYLQKEATAEEKEHLLDWLRESEANKKHFSGIRDIWLATATSPVSEPDYSKKAFASFAGEVKRQDRRSQSLGFPLFVRVAASFALLVACSVGGYWMGSRQLGGMLDMQQSIVMNHVVMGKGSKGSITLPDGTLAWLNADSRLIYPETFDADSRRVKLEGEAYFEVMHNEQAPFYVETDGMVVNVLGTHFDVRNYSTGFTLETILLSGQVEVFFPATRKRVLLEPNQKITCNKRTGNYETKAVNAADYIVWINDKLVCTNERLADVLHKMKRWYSIDIVCDSGVPLNQRLSLTIRKESPDEIFKLLELIAPVTYKKENNRIRVSPK